MARPIKKRRVGCNPQAIYFKPRGIPVADLDEVVLTMDELEAIRLADLEECYQETAANRWRFPARPLAISSNLPIKKLPLLWYRARH